MTRSSHRHSFRMMKPTGTAQSKFNVFHLPWPRYRIGEWMSEALQQLLANRKKAWARRGIYSVCSAHPWVIQAAMQEISVSGGLLLIEATSNQVNQFGGYTGKLPADFRRSVLELANQVDFPEDRLSFGGDHLGPNPWQHLPASQGMEQAETMVVAYAQRASPNCTWTQACPVPMTPLPFPAATG